MAASTEPAKPESNTEELLALLDYVHARIVDRLQGLSVEEYLWEPVAGCWSVRADADGVYRAEKQYPDPQPAPFTTIAWRSWHLAADCLGGFSARFWEGREEGDASAWPGTPEEALVELDRHWDRFRADLAAMDDAELAAPLGPAAGPYARDSHLALVLHSLDELIHHAAEIGVIRDLYRAGERGAAWAPALTG